MASVTITNPKTGRKEIWVDGVLVLVLYPPPGYVGSW